MSDINVLCFDDEKKFCFSIRHARDNILKIVTRSFRIPAFTVNRSSDARIKQFSQLI